MFGFVGVCFGLLPRICWFVDAYCWFVGACFAVCWRFFLFVVVVLRIVYISLLLCGGSVVVQLFS